MAAHATDIRSSAGEAVRPRNRVRLSEVHRNFFGRAKRAVEHRPVKQGVPVRCFANEDIYFHIKRIDNSRVVRQADPKTGGVCWKMIGSVAAAAVLLIGVLLPSAYGLLAGYQIQALKEEAKRLANEQASLELEEAKLLSPERMEELAREQQFIDPEPQKVIYLDANHGAAVAMNESAAGSNTLSSSGQPKK
jgi:cell division protein FtsL